MSSEDNLNKGETKVTLSPWANVKKHNTSFSEVMTEQLVNTLQEEEEDKLFQEYSVEENDVKDVTMFPAVNPDTSNDVVLAQMLQAEMDRSYNEYLTTKEKQQNQNSKVSINFQNYRTDESFYSDDSDCGEVDETEDAEQSEIAIPAKGYTTVGNTIITKHDKERCGRMNTARMEDIFPEGFLSGDIRGMGLQLPNRIYNSLKRHAYSEEKRSQRLHEDKEHYTAEHAVDEKTRLLLHKMVNRCVLNAVNGVISVGKESVVIHADGGDATGSDGESGIEIPDDIQIPVECAVKVFKTTLNEFRTRDKYIKDDFRFKDRFKKLNPRKIIHMWAEKEMHNLKRLQNARIPCPNVVLLRDHILVMDFIGMDRNPAPKLKNAILSQSQKESAYEQVVNIMTTMFKTCSLVHADMSEYNLLWFRGKVYVIDVSQSVEPHHPNALQFLHRDCTNVSKFFNNIGIEKCLSARDLFNKVSGLNINVESDDEFLSKIEEMQKSAEEHSHQGRNKTKNLFTDQN